MSQQTVDSVSLEELRSRFTGAGLAFEAGAGGLPCVRVETSAARAEVYLHGAHVTHFQAAGQAPLLFMSEKSLFAPGKAIRGGVPLIFPWFGPKAGDPSAPQHGFARSNPWRLTKAATDGASATLAFSLSPSPTTRKHFDYDFAATFTVVVGAALEMSLAVSNPASAKGPFSYEEAMHTYLAVGDVRQAAIDGLGGREFIDKVDGFKRKTQPPGPFKLTGETDRVYLNTADAVTVTDPVGKRTITVSKRGSAATVVWNPWIDKARGMSDFGDDEWPGMLCIETANAGECAVTLAPGESHVMWASIRGK